MKAEKFNERSWCELGPLVEKYAIGSEGGSAWVWLGNKSEDMECVGVTAPTQRLAIEKLIKQVYKELV